MGVQTPSTVAKRAIFKQEFRSVIEDKNIFSPVATKLIAKAKNIYSPFTSVDAAKLYTTPCVVPVSPLNLGVDELVLDRYIGNAITDCKEELDYANFDITGSARRDLYATVMKKANQVAAADFLADATTLVGTVDLSTADKVATFLITVKAEAEANAFSVAQYVDGATIKRAEKHGMPFVVAGTTAFVAIISKVAGIAQLSSLVGLTDGKMIETPYGVVVINGAGAFKDPKQMLYGVAGIPTLGYREDQIEVDMGRTVAITTFNEPSADLDLDPGDNIIKDTFYMYARTKGNNGIFSNVATLVKAQKMA